MTRPILNLDATIANKSDARSWLANLAESAYAYHLDDDPREIHGREVGDKISILIDLCFGFLGEAELWEVYGDAYEAALHDRLAARC